MDGMDVDEHIEARAPRAYGGGETESLTET